MGTLLGQYFVFGILAGYFAAVVHMIFSKGGD